MKMKLGESYFINYTLATASVTSGTQTNQSANVAGEYQSQNPEDSLPEPPTEEISENPEKSESSEPPGKE